MEAIVRAYTDGVRIVGVFFIHSALSLSLILFLYYFIHLYSPSSHLASPMKPKSIDNKLFRFVKPALFVLVFALAAGTLYAWSAPPSGTPPTCPPGLTGCDAPINVSNNL